MSCRHEIGACNFDALLQLQSSVIEPPKKRRGRPPRGSAANHARAAAAAAAAVNKPRLGEQLIVSMLSLGLKWSEHICKGVSIGPAVHG